MLAVSSYLTHTVSVPELVWTIVTGLGFYCNFFLTREAGRDLKLLRKSKINSIREYAAVTSYVSEMIKMYVQFSFFMLGVVAMLIPSSNTQNVPTFQWVLTLNLILTAAVMSGSAFLERARRRRLIELINEYELA